MTRTQSLSTMVMRGAVCALLFGAAQAARADFIFLSQSAVFDPSTRDVTFTIVFNEAPDFSTVDSYGRQADSFQIDVIGDASQPFPAKFDSIVRGEELHITGRELRIRNVSPPDPDPAAHGWGTVRGEVPITLDGDVLTFSAPLSVLSDHSTDGEFAYTLQTTEYGDTTERANGQTSVTPEPDSVVLVGTGLLGLFAAGRRRYRASRLLSFD